jgi:hypothetical protein
MIILKPYEMYLEAACFETDTAEKCKDAMENIKELRTGVMGYEEYEDLLAAENHMLAKGNLLRLEAV